LFAELVASGVTSGQYAVLKKMQPKQESKEDLKTQILEELKSDSIGDLGAGGDTSPKTFMEAWQAIKDETKCSTEQAMSKAVQDYPDLYDAMKGGK